MREDLTQTFHHALEGAQASARELNQDFVGTEHLMLGLLQTDGEAVRVLQLAHADPEQLKTELRSSLPRAQQEPVVTGDLPLSPKAQRIVNAAIVLAQAERQSHISTRFLLLSLLKESHSVICNALNKIGADTEALQFKLTEKPHVAET